MDKGYPNMEARDATSAAAPSLFVQLRVPVSQTIGTNMKKEMIDFISFYRRFTNVAGRQVSCGMSHGLFVCAHLRLLLSQSFSTLYTAINVLAGHYTS